MNKKKITIGMAAILMMPVVAPIVLSVHAVTDDNDSVQLEEDIESVSFLEESDTIKNDLYIQFEEELEEIEQNGEEISEDELMQLIEKYDGAEITQQPINQGPSSRACIGGVSVKFVSGGVNVYASTKKSLGVLRSLMQNSSDARKVFSLLIGEAGLNVILQFIGGEALDVFFPISKASSILGKMVNRGRTNRGVRFTFGNAKAIYSPSAT